MADYYIIEHSSRKGPYDLLGITRKIRNGSLDKEDIIHNQTRNEQGPAYQHEELYEAFIEQDAYERLNHDDDYSQSRGLLTLLGNAFGILKDSQAPIVFCGIFFLFASAVAIAAYLTLPLISAALIAPVIIYFMFGILQICILRLFRVQLLSFRYIYSLLKKHGLTLLLASMLPAILGFSLPWIGTMFIGNSAIIIGTILAIIVMTYFAYLPLIVVERNANFPQALKLNHKIFMHLGVERWTNIAGLMLLLVISFPLVITPLFTIPITLLALCDIHDKNAVNY